jgi:uncharacterized membrane protein YfcA
MTPWLSAACFAAALLYSSVGHGGASAYLAILVLAGYDRTAIAPTVLLLNILVTAAGVANYRQAGHLSVRLLLPFALTSIPAAFLGGSVELPSRYFSTLLGATLLIAAARFLLLTAPVQIRTPANAATVYAVGLPLGGLIGFVSGLVGIGGGIFLSPLMLLLGWADAKQTAAVSAGFILLNSLSGLTAHAGRGTADWAVMAPLAVAVLIGGAIGSHLGARLILPITLQRLLGAVLLLAGIKLIGEAL